MSVWKAEKRVGSFNLNNKKWFKNNNFLKE